MAAPVINTPAHLEHRIKTPDGRTLAVAEWGDPDGLPVIAMHGTAWRSHLHRVRQATRWRSQGRDNTKANLATV